MKDETKLSRKDFLKMAGLGLSVFGLSGCNSFFEPDFEKKITSLTGKNQKGSLQLKFIRGVARNLPVFSRNSSVNNGVSVYWDQFQNKVELVINTKENLSPIETIVAKNHNPFKNSFRKKIQNPCYQALLGAIHPIDHMLFYYDSRTFDLLGSEYTLKREPQNSIVRSFPVQFFLRSPVSRLKSGGVFELKWQLDFDNVLSSQRTAGHEYVFAPKNIRKEGCVYQLIHTKKRKKPISFEHFLKTDGLVIDTNFEQELKVPTMLANFDRPIFF
ncbi:MAG: hypothetical protein AAFQ83_19140 [Bacteroidota bacterium]